MTVVSAVVQAAADGPSGVLAGGARYLDWGVIQISLTNFLIVVGMIVLFILALVVPFPPAHQDGGKKGHGDDAN